MTFSIQSLRKIELEENFGKSFVHFLKCFKLLNGLTKSFCTLWAITCIHFMIDLPVYTVSYMYLYNVYKVLYSLPKVHSYLSLQPRMVVNT